MRTKVYERVSGDYGFMYQPVTLTGRWMIDIVDGEVRMYLEKRFLFLFTAWVHEDDIRVVRQETYINAPENKA